MANKKFVVKLSSEERAQLTGLISKGKTAARTALKARILLKAETGLSGLKNFVRSVRPLSDLFAGYHELSFKR